MRKIFFTFFFWIANFIIYSQNVGIGTNTPVSSAKLEINSTNSGLLIPRMTTSQRDAIPSPAPSLLIFNTTTNCYEWWDALGQKWVSMSCGCSVPLPSVPTATSGTNITAVSFNANWNAVPGATTYYIDVAMDSAFTTFVSGYNNLNVGNVLTQNISGLACGTTYYYRVRAENSCGLSESSNIITVNTNVCPPVSFCLAIGGNLFDVAYSVLQTLDGGLVAAGYTQSYGAGSNDMYVVKLDASGNLLWTKTIGGSGDDFASYIVETSDGSLVVAGYTQSYGAGSNDMYIAKLDALGNLLWTKTIGGAQLDYAISVTETSDGGLAIAGWTTSYGAGGEDIYVVKLDASGNLLWTKTIGGSSNEQAYSIIETSDGNLVVAGHTQSYGAGNNDMYIVKLDASGNLLWTRTVGGSSGDNTFSIIEVSDGGLVAVGWTGSYGAGGDDMYLVKLDASGNLLWTKSVGGSSEDKAFSVVETADKGLIVAGRTLSYGVGSYDVHIVKFDSLGNLLWTRTVGGGNVEQVYSITETIDGGIVVSGITNSYGTGDYDMYLVKLDVSGNLSCTNGCQVNSGGIIGSGGAVNSGGVLGNGGIIGNGGITATGGTLINICAP